MRADEWPAGAEGSARASTSIRRNRARWLRTGISADARRRTGIGLLVFGIAGLVILGTSALFILASLGSLGPTGGDLQSQIGAIDRSLDATTSTLESTKSATGNLTASVANASAAARGASSMASQLATTMRDLSGAMNVSFLGTRPFASLGGEFEQVGARSTELAGQMQTLAGSLDANAADVKALSDQIAALESSVRDLRSSIGPGSTLVDTAGLLAVARALLLGLVVWLAVPALVAAWFGARLYRSAGRRVQGTRG